MDVPFLLTKAQMRRIEPYFPLSHGGTRVDDRQRHKIENMFGRLKDWRRIHTRYDRCAHTFMSAIAIAATVIFWLS
jgi:transposase